MLHHQVTDFGFFQKALKEILCCPQCKCDLENNHKKLKCLSCYQTYKVDNGILILMAKNSPKAQADENRWREELAKKHKGASSDEILKIISQHHCIPVMSKKGKDFRAKFDSSQWVLDAGCGTGYYWQKTNGGNLILIDFTLGNIREAQTLLQGEKHILFIKADLANLPIKTCSLSGVFSVQVTQHLPESILQSFFKELKRVMAIKNFLIEDYRLNPAFLLKVIYKLFRKKFHIKGRAEKMTLNRLDTYELLDLWKEVIKNSKLEVEYSELFFHPDLRIKMQCTVLATLENKLKRLVGCGHSFARQIQVKVSPENKKF